MIESAIKELIEYNMKMKDAIDDIVHRFRIQENDEALNLIYDYVIEGIQWEVEMISGINPMVGDINLVTTINQALIEAVEAIENNDYILVADLFEYELKPAIEKIDYVNGEK